MPAAKSSKKASRSSVKRDHSFASFISDPLIATALIVFALIALVLSIIEFSQAIAF